MPDVITEIAPMHVLTASDVSGTYYAILPGATKGDRMAARIQYVNALQASGSGVWTFTVQVSYNLGVAWTTVGTGAAITLTAVAQDGEQLLGFSPTTAPDTGQTWVQVLATLTGAPTTPTIAYRADLVGGPW